MKDYSLTSFTVCYLDLLINLYNSRKIDYTVFYNISKLKIKFLEDSISSIQSLEEKNKILSILANCKKIYCHLES